MKKLNEQQRIDELAEIALDLLDRYRCWQGAALHMVIDFTSPMFSMEQLYQEYDEIKQRILALKKEEIK